MISNFKFRQFVFKLLTPMVRFNDWQIDHIGLYNGEQRLKRLSMDQADQLIADKINSGEPFTVARYGHTEFCCIMKVGRQSYWHGRLSRTGVHSAIYLDWENLYLEASKDVDILAVWNYRTNYLAKKKLVKNLPNISHFVPLKYSNPFGDKKWINALKNKKILVIHPFVKSIELQNTKREQIGILPEFKQLEIIKPVVSYVNTESQFDWFGALHSMQDEIAQKDFEIALIGCGPYGFPLATYVKSLGKQAIHLGGVTQLLFGIKGKRWFNEPGFAETVNEYWITPLEEDIPPRLREIENGCYIG